MDNNKKEAQSVPLLSSSEQRPNTLHVTPECFVFNGDQRMRVLRPKLVDELAKDMAERGQLEPLVCTKNPGGGYNLLAGRHRLEAARKLKWEHIRIEVREPMSPDEMKMVEIAENLIREELSEIELGQRHDEAKKIYERLNPQTTRAAISARSGRVGAKKSNGIDNTGDLSLPYTKITAKKLGVSKNVIEDKVRHGKIPSIERAIGSSLDNVPELRALHRLQKIDPVKAQDLITRAAAGEKVTAIEPSTAAEEFAQSILSHYEPSEIPTVITWLQQVSAKGVVAALRRSNVDV